MLTKEQFLKALEQLGDKLSAEGKTGELLLVGGAAMSLVFDARDMTKDIDALYEPKSDINRLAEEIAHDMNLPSDWLNDGVKGFVATTADSQEFLTFSGLRINSVTPEYLFAMKLLSARLGDTDLDDIRFLVEKLDIKTPNQAYAILERYYPSEQIMPKTMYLIEELLP
jgi:hypothetical protein